MQMRFKTESYAIYCDLAFVLLLLQAQLSF